MKITAIPYSARSRVDEKKDLLLRGDVERSGWLVGDEQGGIASQCKGDHRTLAHATRKLVRVIVDPCTRIGDADLVQKLQRTFASFRRGRAGCG